MSMLEAMAFELPVIVTPVGGIPEIVTQECEGLYVQPGNINEIMEAMERLIVDPEKRRIMGKEARQRVSPFCIESYMEALLEVYRRSITDN